MTKYYDNSLQKKKIRNNCRCGIINPESWLCFSLSYVLLFCYMHWLLIVASFLLHNFLFSFFFLYAVTFFLHFFSLYTYTLVYCNFLSSFSPCLFAFFSLYKVIFFFILIIVKRGPALNELKIV